MRWIAFDVETPNAANARMSAIGVTVVEDGRIAEEFATIVNPEVPFAPFNIALTGITPAMAADAPTFGELWPVLEPIFSSGILAAHNAPFDMSVLSKCLRAYGIRWRAAAQYVCTCQIARRCCRGVENHKLNTLCAHYGISLDHHQAASDSRACAELLLRYQKAGVRPEHFLRTYDMVSGRTITRR